MIELIDLWRERVRVNPGLRVLASDVADEIEQAWHEDQHNAEWRPEICRVCVREMEKP